MRGAAGAFVSSVGGERPADKAGRKAWRRVIKYEGKPVESSSDLRRMVASTKPGSKVPRPCGATAARRDVRSPSARWQPDQPRQAPPIRGRERPCRGPLASCFDIAPDQQKELKIKGGVQVDNVDGPAALAGIRTGDYIVSINNVE